MFSGQGPARIRILAAPPIEFNKYIGNYGDEWDRAWSIAQNVFGYTNHTVLPEALEKRLPHLVADAVRTLKPPKPFSAVAGGNPTSLSDVTIRWLKEVARTRGLTS